MSDEDSDKLDSIPPLGKSAEEVEREEGNRVNPGARSDQPDGEASFTPVVSTNLFQEPAVGAPRATARNVSEGSGPEEDAQS